MTILTKRCFFHLTHALRAGLSSDARSGLLLVALAAAVSATGPARAEPAASDWSTGLHAAIRLLDGGPGAVAGTRSAGIEIRLDPHFKTYWRMPGDAGVPPTFDWSASTNVAQVTVRWPVPSRFEDAGSWSVGYTDGLVLPLDVVAQDPGRPVTLSLAMTYAVCENICVPVDGNARLALDAPALSTPAAARIAEARERVPAQVKVGGREPPAIPAVQLAPGGDAVLVDVLREPDGDTDIFVEGPDGWLFGRPAAQGQGDVPGATRWRVPVLATPGAASTLAGVPLTLTVAGRRAGIEATVTLPLAAPPPPG